MTDQHDRDWDHKRTVRAGSICAGHLNDAVFNALQRVVWQHYGDDQYWTALLTVCRDLFGSMVTEAGQHQEELTDLLQEALLSAGERCRSDNPTGEPAYKRRWQADANAYYDQRARKAVEQAEQEEANARARADRLERERRN